MWCYFGKDFDRLNVNGNKSRVENWKLAVLWWWGRVLVTVEAMKSARIRIRRLSRLGEPNILGQLP
jgi:hypothetical protein